MQLVFQTSPGRSQRVLLTKESLAGGTEEWLVIDVALRRARIGQPAEGLGRGRRARLRWGGSQWQPCRPPTRRALANLDVNEFERPLVLVTGFADILESRLFGGDKYSTRPTGTRRTPRCA